MKSKQAEPWGEKMGRGVFHKISVSEPVEHVTYTLRRDWPPSTAPGITDTVYSILVTARHASIPSKHAERLNLVTGRFRSTTPNLTNQDPFLLGGERL